MLVSKWNFTERYCLKNTVINTRAFCWQCAEPDKNEAQPGKVRLECPLLIEWVQWAVFAALMEGGWEMLELKTS